MAEAEPLAETREAVKAAAAPISDALISAAVANGEKQMAFLVFSKDNQSLYSAALPGTPGMITNIVKSKVTANVTNHRRVLSWSHTGTVSYHHRPSRSMRANHWRIRPDAT